MKRLDIVFNDSGNFSIGMWSETKKPRDRDTFFPRINHVVGEPSGVSPSLQKTIAIDRLDNYLDVIP